MITPTEALLYTPVINGMKHVKSSASLSSSCSATFVDAPSLYDLDDSTHDFPSERSQVGPLVKPSPRSILKSRTKSEPRYVKEGKSCWMCLPPPAEFKQLPASSTTDTTESKSVGFGSVTVRGYQQTMGDNPAVSYGPPISLDWEYEQEDPVDLDLFESERVFARRNMRQMVLSYYRRKAILTRDYGFTEEELVNAKKDADKRKLKRSVTNALLPIMKVEDALESAGRKAKRVIGLKA